MSARNALWMALVMGIDPSPNLLAEASDEELAIKRGCTVRELYRRPKPYDHDLAARLRAERAERKRANYQRRTKNEERRTKTEGGMTMGIYDFLPESKDRMPGWQIPVLDRKLTEARAEIDLLRTALIEVLDHADYFSERLDGCGAGMESHEEDRCNRLYELSKILNRSADTAQKE